MSTKFISPIVCPEIIDSLDVKQAVSFQDLMDVYLLSNDLSGRRKHFVEASFGLIYQANFVARGNEPQSASDSLSKRFPWIESAADQIHSDLYRLNPILVPLVHEQSSYFGDDEQKAWLNRNVLRWLTPKGNHTTQEICEGVALGRFAIKQD